MSREVSWICAFCWRSYDLQKRFRWEVQMHGHDLECEVCGAKGQCSPVHKSHLKPVRYRLPRDVHDRLIQLIMNVRSDKVVP